MTDVFCIFCNYEITNRRIWYRGLEENNRDISQAIAPSYIYLVTKHRMHGQCRHVAKSYLVKVW